MSTDCFTQTDCSTDLERSTSGETDKWAARFWKRVERSPGCWLWTGARRGGYGLIRQGNAVIGAHRASYIIHFGAVPDGLFVCHHCDNRPCVNPAHLYAGTPAENSADMYRRGRVSVKEYVPPVAPEWSGENNPRSKLTNAAVLSIRQRWAREDRPTQRTLGAEYGVDASLISDVVRRRIWRHI